MRQTEIVEIVRSALKEAAKKFGCKPSEALNPTKYRPDTVKARNLAIRMSSEKGLTRKQLTMAFNRDEKTIRNALKSSELN
jgi:hypothetical protein